MSIVLFDPCDVEEVHPVRLRKDGDIFCLCGDNWICGPCATQKKILNHCGHCPKCQNCFCFYRCRYIDVCADCRKTTLCNDCMEEDMSDEEGSSAAIKGASLMATCEECRGRICTDCFEEFGSCCESCNSVHCQDCVDHEECLDCGALMCTTCATEDGCRNCEEG
ncbi:hypothetical protein EDB19DRAFT_1762564, partial [Suillus lakei]